MFLKSFIFCFIIFIQWWYQIQANFDVPDHELKGVIEWKYEKRPFCNAFTGCGKKRTSSHPPYPIMKRRSTFGDTNKPISAGLNAAGNYNNNNNNNNNNNLNDINNDYMYEGLADLFDVNAEPAVENVQNKIMSNAKIYEAIKEASKEILRQKNKQRDLRARIAEGQ